MGLLNTGLLNTGLLNTGLLNNENDFAIENPLLGAQRAPQKNLEATAIGSQWGRYTSSQSCGLSAVGASHLMSDLSGYWWYHIGYIIGGIT